MKREIIRGKWGRVMKRFPILTGFVVLLLTFGAQANAFIIDFDDVSNGTVINNHYSGVTFTMLLNGTDGGLVYARDTSGAESLPNVVSVFGTGFPFFDNRFGTIHAAFSAPQTSVSIDTLLTTSPEGFGASGTAYLKAYNSGVLIGTSTTTDLEMWKTLSVSGSGITDVYFTVQFNQMPTYGYFDNFNYSSGGTGGPGPGGEPVPEPSTILLLGGGLLGLVVYRKRKS